MLDKTEQSDRASNPNEKPESCYARHCRRGPACAYPAIRDGWPAGVRKQSGLALLSFAAASDCRTIETGGHHDLPQAQLAAAGLRG